MTTVADTDQEMSLVERLRLGGPNAWEVYGEAADEIERLSAKADTWITTAGQHAAACDEKEREIERLRVDVERIAGSWKVIDQLRAINANQAELLAGARTENERFYAAISSIARNTCCDRCQEAAKVAQRALQP